MSAFHLMTNGSRPLSSLFNPGFPYPKEKPRHFYEILAYTISYVLRHLYDFSDLTNISFSNDTPSFFLKYLNHPKLKWLFIHYIFRFTTRYHLFVREDNPSRPKFRWTS